MEGNNQTFVFKIIFGEDMRRISFSNQQTFHQLYLSITSLFRVNNLQLSWKDNEENLLILKNDQDLKDCLKFYIENGLKSLKLVAKLPQQQPEQRNEEPTMQNVEESFASMKTNDNDQDTSSDFPYYYRRRYNYDANNENINTGNKDNNRKEWKRGLRKEWKKENGKHKCQWKKYGKEGETKKKMIN